MVRRKRLLGAGQFSDQVPNKVDSDGNPVVYKVGDPDRVAVHHKFMGGIDMRFYTRKSTDADWEEMDATQGVSWVSKGGWGSANCPPGSIDYRDVTMDMIQIFDADYKAQYDCLAEYKLCGVNKYGWGVEMLFSDFDIESVVSGGVAIDDVVLTIKHTFKGGLLVIKFIEPEKKDE